MADAREVYQSHPEDYDALVRCEDRGHNLLPAIQALVPRLAGAEVVELGAGTGRVTLLLAPEVRSIRAFDIAAPMVDVARRHLRRLASHNWEIGVADNASVPLPDDTADLAIAGWTYGHQTVWQEDWRSPIALAVREMLRVLRPGGTAVVIETLGTGHTTPFQPPPQLAQYYAMLVEELGFASTWVRTDYEFSSLAEGERLVRLFFGDDRARVFVAGGSTVLPECTGLWWRSK